MKDLGVKIYFYIASSTTTYSRLPLGKPLGAYNIVIPDVKGVRDNRQCTVSQHLALETWKREITAILSYFVQQVCDRLLDLLRVVNLLYLHVFDLTTFAG